MATAGSASLGDPVVVADDTYHATTRAAMLRGSTLIKLALVREISQLSRRLESKMAQQRRCNTPEVEARLKVEIKKIARQLGDLKMSSNTILFELKAAATVCGDNELATHIAALLDGLNQAPGTQKTFNVAALGIIPVLPSFSVVPAADNGRPDPLSTNSATPSAAVSDESQSDSLADTLFNDLYKEPDEKPSNHPDLSVGSNADEAYETDHHFSSDDDSVFEDTQESDSVGLFKLTPSGSPNVNDIVSLLTERSFWYSDLSLDHSWSALTYLAGSNPVICINNTVARSIATKV